MESFSFRKWTCLTIALLAVVLIEDSMAWKCFEGEYYLPPTAGFPKEKDCSDDKKGACMSTIRSDGYRIKACVSADAAEKLVGGTDTCTTEPWNGFAEKEIRLDYRDGTHFVGDEPKAGQSEEDYVKEWVDIYTNRWFQGTDLTVDLTVCACSTESCNTDANTDALVQQSAGKPIPTLPPANSNGKNSNGAATALLADSGNLGAAMLLALAVLAALVPGSGFRRSQ